MLHSHLQQGNIPGVIQKGGYAFILTKSFAGSGGPGLSAGPIIDYYEESFTQLGFFSNGGSHQQQHPVIHDLTDGAGHGILVATDSIFFGVLNPAGYGAGGANSLGAEANLLYRWKDVSIEEYIGIVQSQQ